MLLLLGAMTVTENLVGRIVVCPHCGQDLSIEAEAGLGPQAAFRWVAAPVATAQGAIAIHPATAIGRGDCIMDT